MLSALCFPRGVYNLAGVTSSKSLSTAPSLAPGPLLSSRPASRSFGEVHEHLTDPTGSTPTPSPSTTNLLPCLAEDTHIVAYTRNRGTILESLFPLIFPNTVSDQGLVLSYSSPLTNLTSTGFIQCTFSVGSPH